MKEYCRASCPKVYRTSTSGGRRSFPALRALDVLCGTGNMLNQLTGARMPDANQTLGSRSHRSLALLATRSHLAGTSTPRCAASQIMHAAGEDDSQTPLHQNQPCPIVDPGSTTYQRGRPHANHLSNFAVFFVPRTFRSIVASEKRLT